MTRLSDLSPKDLELLYKTIDELDGTNPTDLKIDEWEAHCREDFDDYNEMDIDPIEEFLERNSEYVYQMSMMALCYKKEDIMNEARRRFL